MIARHALVQYELLRPAQVRARQQQRPIAYLPVGSLEWHGLQNPLGTDGLKAHAICCEAALELGGVVLPTLFLGILGDSRGWGPEGWEGFTITAHDQSSMEDTIYRVARGLVADGWKVLVGVTGHDVHPQRDALHDGIQRACQGTQARGFGVMEGEDWQGSAELQYTMDHAGAWETSAMLHAQAERVDLGELEKQMRASGRQDLDKTQMVEPEGIGGWNPLKYASDELGQRIIALCAARIGRKAIDVLEGRFTPPQKAGSIFADGSGAAA